MDIFISDKQPLTNEAHILLVEFDELNSSGKLENPLFPITSDNKNAILFFLSSY